MTTVIIFGASGFIGRNILEYFSKVNEYNIIAVANTATVPSEISDNIEWLNLDLRYSDSIKHLPSVADCVFQFSASTSAGNSLEKRKLSFIYDNALINTNILQYVATNLVRHFVYPSCSTVYQSSLHPVGEDDFDANQPFSKPYRGSANVKSYIEGLCNVYSELLETRFSVVRHSNLYGPYDKYFLPESHVCASLISKAFAANDNSILEIWGDGKLQRDLLYVEDFCVALRCFMEQQPSAYEIFNIGSGKLVSINELASIVINCCGKNLNIVNKPTISTTDFISCLDISKFTANYNWKPETSLHSGISKSLKWLQKSRSDAPTLGH